MKSHAPIRKSILLLVWSVFLTGMTVILGAAPLKPVRTGLGAGPFWLLGLGFSILFWALKLPALGCALLLFTVMIGVWVEFEERSVGFVQSASAGILAASALAMGAFGFVLRRDPTFWQTKVISTIEAVIASVSRVDANLSATLKAQDLALQIPSMLLIALILAAALTAVLERPFSIWAGHIVKKKQKLSDFRVPDLLIWVLLPSVFFSFWQGSGTTVSVIATNLLNVLAVVYFLQGFAVLGKYFDTFKVGYFWRVIWIVLFTFQLFLLLALVGVIDFWADFRKHIVKRGTELKKKSISE